MPKISITPCCCPGSRKPSSFSYFQGPKTQSKNDFRDRTECLGRITRKHFTSSKIEGINVVVTNVAIIATTTTIIVIAIVIELRLSVSKHRTARPFALEL